MNKTLVGLFSIVLAFLPVSVFGGTVIPDGAPDRLATGPTTCEDFARRQIGIADGLLGKDRYTRALKVLNRTVENCDREFVREKIVEVYDQWFSSARAQGVSALQEFLGVLSEQSHMSASAKSGFKSRIQGHVRSLIAQEYNGQNYRAAYTLCREYSEYASGSFNVEYYCGSSAEQLGAYSVAMRSYEWMLDNWSGGQSLAAWGETAGTLERLYFWSGRFDSAYDLARDRATRDPSPDKVLMSLISLRGEFLSPVLRVGGEFFETDPSDDALSVLGQEMQNVNFPKYVNSLYLIDENREVQRGMYGKSANVPAASLLDNAFGTLSLLQSRDDSNRAWLVSPVGDGFLILEFGVATSHEESVRLESVLNNIEEDTQWEKLYDLEFKETSPASGSAVGTFLSAASIDDEDPDSYNAVFDDSQLLAYYCIQNDSGTIQGGYDFDRDNLKYGEDVWQETSTTPALYHHATEYNGRRVREVVWPRFANDNWTGVVRVGLARR